MQFPLAIFSCSTLAAAAAKSMCLHIVQYIIQCFFISFSSRSFLESPWCALSKAAMYRVHSIFPRRRSKSGESEKAKNHTRTKSLLNVPLSHYWFCCISPPARYSKRIHFGFVNIQNVQTDKYNIAQRNTK